MISRSELTMRTGTVRHLRIAAPRLVAAPPGCTPGAPCPSCGQKVPGRPLSVSLTVNMEVERARWAGRAALAIAHDLASYECDGFRILARIVERIGDRVDADRVGYRFSARDLASDLGVSETTLHDRWKDARLPGLKEYFDALNLLRVASVAETYPGEPAHRQGRRLGFAHKPCYTRWLKRVSGMTPAQFAAVATEASQLEVFLSRYVRPYAAALRTGHFLGADIRVAKRLAARKEQQAR